MTEATSILAGHGGKWRQPYNPRPLRHYRQLHARELTNALQLAVYAEAWRGSFDRTPLESHYWQVDRQLRTALHLADRTAAWRRDVDLGVLGPVFGLNRSDHAFAAPRIDWGTRLTELQATKTLAKLLDEGSNPLRARRIAAFLKALGVEDVAPDDLRHSAVTAEQDRIDLQITWPKADGGNAVVIVEAKLDYSLSEKQLAIYRKATRRRYGYAPDRSILLGLHQGIRKKLKGRQHSIWEFVTWRGLWLQFEKHRPEENSPNLTIFLHTLWHRIGGLK